MNHNKYPSSCKVLGQKWWWTKLKYKFYSSNDVKQNAFKNVHHTTICPIYILSPKVCSCIVYRWLKGSGPILIKKCSIRGILKHYDIVFLKGRNQSGPSQEENIELWDAPTFECIT